MGCGDCPQPATPVQEGMVIRTHTAQLQAVRGETLRLILSEHPCSCLICDEKDECKKNVTTIRKAGITTGCRYCPNDGQCELQEVVEKIGVTEVDYPVYYRHLNVKKDDPFFDRDYNLCIFCGRCVRMCQEVRAANTLAFTRRGRHTVIGPAYDRRHLEAGCEFCGACVSVCPTGALYEKTRKWDGPPDGEQITHCPLCGVGCALRLLTKGGRIMGSLPAGDHETNEGQLCVKGRFCVTELAGSHERLKKPYRREENTNVEISWDQAVQTAAEILSACPPDRFGLIVSADCSNEDLYVAQKFARVVMRSHNVDTSARSVYRSGFTAYLNLMRTAVPLSSVREASTVVCIGLDTRFGASVVGVAVREAIRKGAKVITLHPRDHNLALIANKWIQPLPGRELAVLNSLVWLTQKETAGNAPPGSEEKHGCADQDLEDLAEMLGETSNKVILVGSEYVSHRNSSQILGTIARLAQNTGSGVLPVVAQSNLVGSVLMGAYPDLLPGAFSSQDTSRLGELGKAWGTSLAHLPSVGPSEAARQDYQRRALYLIGAVPSHAELSAEFSIFQNIYPPPAHFRADLVLPAAAFSEVDGTLSHVDGSTLLIRQAVSPPGEALPDWEILCRIARAMGFKGFDFASPGEVHQEVSSLVKGSMNFRSAHHLPLSLDREDPDMISPTVSSKSAEMAEELPFILTSSISEHTYRGFPISARVDGARELFPDATVEISREDAAEAGLSQDDNVLVISPAFEIALRARIVPNQAKGRLHVSVAAGGLPGSGPHPARIVKTNV